VKLNVLIQFGDVGPKYGPLKARDFLSVVSFFRFDNGTNIILNRPAYHDDYPPSKEYVRATILLAGNIIEPYGRNQTKLTTIAHVNPGGGADTAVIAWMINKMCAIGPPTFMRKLEEAAQTSSFEPHGINNFFGVNTARLARQFQRNVENFNNEVQKFNKEVKSFFEKVLPKDNGDDIDVLDVFRPKIKKRGAFKGLGWASPMVPSWSKL
jgi:hypothetical protein